MAFLGPVQVLQEVHPILCQCNHLPQHTMLQKGAVLKWTKQCNNACNLLKSDLVKMPRLQYPNPNKPFKLYMNASKHSYLGILHEEEVSDQPNLDPHLVPIPYFTSSLIKHNSHGTLPKRSIMQSIGPFKKNSFYLAGTKCTLL